jgi:hypothetical protein
VLPKYGGRPPPCNAGDLPNEQPTRKLDHGFNGNTAPSQGVPRERLAFLARRIHRLGERPLFELFVELSAGAPLLSRLERYAELEPLAGFIRAFDGDRLPPARLIAGRRT